MKVLDVDGYQVEWLPKETCRLCMLAITRSWC